MEKLKNKIEAILFSAGKKVNIEEIAKLANTSTSMAQQALLELKKDYNERPSSLLVVDEGNAWKIIVKDEYTPIFKKIVTETELSKTVM
jgi:chromosome segregation and condensation protein ScpB